MNRYSLALVTGASSGIGEALCRLLAGQGIDLLISGRNQEKLDRLKDELAKKVTVTSFAADLSIPEERAMLIDKVRYFVPDLVINNAGYGLYGSVLSHETEASMELIEVDVNAVVQLSIEAARALASQKREGVIMNVSSIVAFFPFPNLALYAAAKAFVNSFSASFDHEMQPCGIRILAACPGQVDTHFRERAGGKERTSEEKKSVMSAEFAAVQIWKQIQKQKPIHVFSRSYWLMSLFSRFIPRQLLMTFLQAGIAKKSKSLS